MRRKNQQTVQEARRTPHTFRRVIANGINRSGPFFGKTHPLA
ncbi:hypothetical protein [Azospirillum largimobile]